MIYKHFVRPLLFTMDPEGVHHLSFRLLKFASGLPGFGSLSRKRYKLSHPVLQRELFGLKFPNPVGLAAGFDKDAKAFRELSDLGFGFIEIGTITPKPQSGNPKKRLFRLKADNAIINRMGFNNDGVEAAVDRIKSDARQRDFILGGNIGKNKTTPNENAVDDYLICYEALYDHVDYFVVNVSSPNTPGLRSLQEKEPLKHILQTLLEAGKKKDIHRPLLLKIAPDLTDSQLDDVCEIVAETGIDGLIATNTTIERQNLQSDEELISEQGGLSGAPLTQRATEVISYIHKKSNGAFPIIAVGGIITAQDALDKLAAGADLVQLYTGFVYEGPRLVKEINKAVLHHVS